MARIRTIKPDFFFHEGLAELSPFHRLLFVGLWTLADKLGLLEDRPARIKAQLFPWDACDVDEMLGDLAGPGFIVRYQVDDVACISIPSFGKHQRVHPKEVDSGLPMPPMQKPGKVPAGLGSIPSSPAGKGREGKEILDSGKEISLKALSTSSTGPAPELPGLALEPTDPPRPKLGDGFEVFAHWQAALGHPTAKPDPKRLKAVKARLLEGYSVADLKQAIDGCARTPHNMGQNDKGQRFDDLELICRNASNVDRFRANAEHPPTGPPRDWTKGRIAAEESDWAGVKNEVTDDF